MASKAKYQTSDSAQSGIGTGKFGTGTRDYKSPKGIPSHNPSGQNAKEGNRNTK